MYKPLGPDKLVKILAGLLLAMFTYQAKCLCDRVEALEKTQGRICVRLGIDPVSHNSHSQWGIDTAAEASPRNPANQKSAQSQNNFGFSP